MTKFSNSQIRVVNPVLCSVHLCLQKIPLKDIVSLDLFKVAKPRDYEIDAQRMEFLLG